MSVKEKHFQKRDIQTVLKHILLENYLVRWAKVLSNASFGTNLKRVHFVDCFAGKGTFDDGDHGSPKIASENLFHLQGSLQKKYEKSIKFFIHTIEAHREYYNALQSLKRQAPFPEQVSNNYGTFEEHIDNMLRKTKGYPSLFFIDPFGYKGLPMPKIQQILNQQSHEILINVMSYSLVRNHNIKNNQLPLKEFFGLNELNEDISEYLEIATENNITTLQTKNLLQLEDKIIELYKSQLKKNSGEELFVLSKRIFSKLNPNVYFHLVFATKNLEGLRQMKESMVDFEQLKITAEDKYIRNYQLGGITVENDLFSDDVQSSSYEYRDFLNDFLSQFNNKKTSYFEFVKFYLEETPLPFRSDVDKSIYNFMKRLSKTKSLTFLSQNNTISTIRNAKEIIFTARLNKTLIDDLCESDKMEQLKLF
ncbi:three-Cys-motif partner protein TcmP [Fictibacillus sp. BK138]|uniref:three-Cys-motif partner protein TcmP n=1 Tax=Fictibacillus sp. BK138 TaxID=2512121 RepID=UPI00102A755D|nr:three-Cys-motif partner protein TcmP [Fictibacillus sp. BK138]RZT15564.1 three-Cys-motif partner protein [Fictibacillus sp. BK138]